jgi:8-oxo-dGTP pyrophosphatase MutT (NUDIX family)
VAGVEETYDADRFAYLAAGNARQARKRVAVDVLIRDTSQRILLVNPNYKDHWDIPGGMAEANEPPLTAAKRELKEELGLPVDIGRLLVINWVGPHGPWDDQLVLVFDGGVLGPEQADGLEIADHELTEFEFVGLTESKDRLRHDMWELLSHAYDRLHDGTTGYLETVRY